MNFKLNREKNKQAIEFYLFPFVVSFDDFNSVTPKPHPVLRH